MKTPLETQENFTNNQSQHHLLIDEESEKINKIVLSDIEIDENMCKKQTELILDDTPVYFPHQPYDVQKIYMESVIKSLNKKQNALLESPTGTGKTLSLLCATLAWLKKNRKDQLNSEQPKNIKIIYSSRTHTQLKQVAMELKKTVYIPKISMLGSRDLYCIRGDFSMIKGTILNQNCRKSIQSSKCEFYQKSHIQQMASNYSTLINTLEGTKQFGYKNKVCPYYFERERLDFADLILIPYNYLLQKDFQDIIDIRNSILIFDEAHNIQKTAEEGSSFVITHNNIIEAEKDLKKWIDELESAIVSSDKLRTKSNIDKIQYNLKEYKSIMITIRVFAQFMEKLKQREELQHTDSDENYLIMNARKIQYMIFENTQDKNNTFRLWSDNSQTNYAKGVNKNNFQKYLNHCQILIDTMSNLSSNPGNYFESWYKFMRNVYDLIKIEDEREKQNLSLDSLSNEFNKYKLSFIVDQQNQLSINMWCLDPSLSFQKLCNKNIHSMLLTSGTLTPIASWNCEIQQPFDIQLVNNHIIDLDKNIRVFQHQSFDFSFNQRNNEEQIDRLGITLLNLCKTIPNGILVVFSSYSMMNKFKFKWTQNNIIKKLSEIKACLWENQQSNDIQNIFDKYQEKSKKGAIMFAVHRGKLTEGIDFSDELCRAIFLVGVPYAAKQDKRLLEKMDYLDKLFSDPEFSNQQRISSREWYSQQAIRVTNQAIGRVIRHINDYGIVYLCDKRFEYKDIKNGFSKWVQPAIQPWINDDQIFQQTKEFFNKTKSIQQHIIKQQIDQKPFQQCEVKKRKIQFCGLQNNSDFQKLKDETYEQMQNYHQTNYKYRNNFNYDNESNEEETNNRKQLCVKLKNQK